MLGHLAVVKSAGVSMVKVDRPRTSPRYAFYPEGGADHERQGECGQVWPEYLAFAFDVTVEHEARPDG